MTKRTPWIPVLLGFVIVLIVASAVIALVVGKDWWQPANALGTLVVGIGVWYVAYQQYHLASQQYTINREKLRFDLLDKRFDVYWSILELLNRQLAYGQLETEHFTELYRRIQESRFLFPADSDAEHFLAEMQSKARQQRDHKRTIEECPGTKEGSDSVKALQELGRWFSDKPNEMYAVFAPYMRMRF